jgi:4-amino-4-deoxy-L-arabinose transferase-like glycosyltransferase
MSETYKVIGVVFVLQLAFLAGSAVLLAHYGESLYQLASGQDSEYIPLAHTMLEKGTFELPPRYFPTSLPVPESFRTPGYPAFVALVFSLSGGSSFVPGIDPPQWGDGFYILLVALCALSAITSGLIYLIARRLALSPLFALSAGVLFGMSPAVIFLPVTALGSDVLYVFFLAAALLFLITLREARHPWWSASALGLLLGLGTLTKPVGLYLSLIILVSLPFFAMHAWPRTRRPFLLLAVSLAVFAATLLPWYIRNAYVFGHFGLSSVPAHTIAHLHIPMFLSWYQGADENTEEAKLMAAVGGGDPYALRSFLYTDKFKEIELGFFHTYLFPYALFHTLKMGTFFLASGMNVQYVVFNIESGGGFNLPFFPTTEHNLASLLYSGNFIAALQNLAQFWPATIERLVWFILFALAFAAPFLTTGHARKFAILGVVFTITLAALASPIAQPRYRIPAEPFIWISAALALSSIISSARRSGMGTGTNASQHFEATLQA